MLSRLLVQGDRSTHSPAMSQGWEDIQHADRHDFLRVGTIWSTTKADGPVHNRFHFHVVARFGSAAFITALKCFLLMLEILSNLRLGLPSDFETCCPHFGIPTLIVLVGSFRFVSFGLVSFFYFVLLFLNFLF